MLDPAAMMSIFQKQPELQGFSAGQVIFEAGQPGEVMYGIAEGEVDLVVNGKVVETIEAKETFGAGVMVGVHTRTYTAIAKTDCKLASLDQRRLLFAVQETPMFALAIMKSYSERVARLTHAV